MQVNEIFFVVFFRKKQEKESQCKGLPHILMRWAPSSFLFTPFELLWVWAVHFPPCALIQQPDEFTEDEDVFIGEGPTLDRSLSSLEKLQIIVGFAISRPNIRWGIQPMIFIFTFRHYFACDCNGSGGSSSLVSSDCCHCFLFGRDEIYCQICKQLVQNKGTRSRMKGWILLSVCLGIFPPTDLFMKVSALQNNSSRSILTHNADCSTTIRKKIIDKNTVVIENCFYLENLSDYWWHIFKYHLFTHFNLFRKTVFGSFPAKRSWWLWRILHWAPAPFNGKWRKKGSALLARVGGKKKKREREKKKKNRKH